MEKKTKIILIVLFFVVVIGIVSMVGVNAVWDNVSEERIKKLHPEIRDKVRKGINKLEKKGIKVRVTSGLRTYAEQDELYKQGRGKCCGIVTNAKGGQSYHNFGLAFDVVELYYGVPLWDNDNWEEIAEVFKDLGFEWGGDWSSFKDLPHFQYTFGMSTSELNNLYVGGDLKNGYVVV